MPRKNETILNLLAASPWWVSIGLSALSYIILKYIVPEITFENLVLNSFSKAAPKVAPLLALILIFPALVSALNSLRKKTLLNRQKDIDSIKTLSWKEFEELMGEAYRRQGYTIIENQDLGPDDQPDGGVDLVIKKSDRIFLVQCKQWRKVKVGVSVVREMYGIMTAQNADGVIIVTSGFFTQEAKNFVIGKSIDLIEGPELAMMINQVQPHHYHSPNPQKKEITNNQPPSCPSCGSVMVLRTAKQGKYAGNSFWGCSDFPKCKGIVSYKTNTSDVE